MIEQMDEIRDSYIKEYIDNNIKVPKETWLLIKAKIDNIIYPKNLEQ